MIHFDDKRFPLPYREPVGIVDIGSNSVRMVVYHALQRVPLPVFNEKYYCGLGKGIAKTGKLNPEGKKLARDILARFAAMSRVMRLSSFHVLATAAIRDAQDGAAFARELEESLGLRLEIISGAREAELGALGILASFHKPHGFTADLGGGSLEIAAIDDGDVTHQQSFPLGVLRLIEETGGKPEAVEAVIQRHLKEAPWLKEKRLPRLYAIGGSFRTLAKLHMKKRRYPLESLDEYSMTRGGLAKLIERLRAMSIDEIKALPGVSEKRAPMLLPAAIVLQQLLKASNARAVVFSVSGIREGFFYDRLQPAERKQDPLLASAADLAMIAGRTGEYATELYDWLSPLFRNQPESITRLCRAFCFLSELAWMVDPMVRGQWVYQRIMQSSLKGMNPRERVALSLALYHRYRSKWRRVPKEIELLTEAQQLAARTMGMGARLAFDLSGGRQGNLGHARLEAKGQDLRLELDEVAKPLWSDTVQKHFDGLGETFSAFCNAAR